MIKWICGRVALGNHARGKLDKATLWYKRALRGAKKPNPNVVQAFGVLKMRQGDFQEAIELFDKALKDRPPKPLRMRIRTNRAIAYYRTGDIDRAIIALEDIHATQKNMLVFQTLGYLYIIREHYDKAKTLNEEAMDYEQNDALILDNVGLMHYKMGNLFDARRYFELAFARNQEKRHILFHLAQLEYDEGNHDAAWDYLIRAEAFKATAMNDLTPEMIAELRTKIEKARMG